MSTEIIAAIISAAAIIIAALIGVLNTRGVNTMLRDKNTSLSLSKELLSKKLKRVIYVIFFIIITVVVSISLLLKRELNIDNGVNKISTKNLQYFTNKEFKLGNSSPYCYYSECPDINSENLRINIGFRQLSIVTDVACLRVVVYRMEDENRKSCVLDEFFEIRPIKNFNPKKRPAGMDKEMFTEMLAKMPKGRFKPMPQCENYIEITNDFEKGQYEILYGFMLKSDFIKTNPTFFCTSCIVTKQ